MEPLDSELAALVDAERQCPGIPADVQARLLQRVGLAIAGGGGGGSGGSGETGHGGAEAPGGSVPTSLGRFFGHRIPFGLTALALGGLAGAGLHAVLTRPARPPTTVTAVAPPGTPDLGPPARAAASAPAPAEEKLEPRRRTARPSTTRASAPAVARDPEEDVARADTELAAERALVETAQAAMARGDALAALATLERSARQFPSGRLTEERDSLRVQALVQVRRYAEARALSDRFRQKFPHSILLPVVNSALDKIP
jgi:hypothetical protein